MTFFFPVWGGNVSFPESNTNGRQDMDVSKNRGTPKSSIFLGFSIINIYKPSILGAHPYFCETPKWKARYAKIVAADWLDPADSWVQKTQSKVWTPYLDVWRLKLQMLYVPGRWPGGPCRITQGDAREGSWTLHAFQNLGKVTGINRCSKSSIMIYHNFWRLVLFHSL